MDLSNFDKITQEIMHCLFQEYPDFKECTEIKTSNINQKKYIYIEVKPELGSGHENLYMIIKKDNVNISYDYCDSYFNLEHGTIEKVINKIKNIFEENIVAMSTRSDSGIIVTPLFTAPSKARGNEKSWNFRIRSWKGTYDSGE